MSLSSYILTLNRKAITASFLSVIYKTGETEFLFGEIVMPSTSYSFSHSGEMSIFSKSTVDGSEKS